MLRIKREGILLEKTDLEFENEGVLNPAVYQEQEGDVIYLFYRAVRAGNHSSLGYCLLDEPLKVSYRAEYPVLLPENKYESQGIEDPRIVKIDNLYYMTYTAYDGINAQSALAISSDLQHFNKKGIIVPKLTYSEFLLIAEANKNLNPKYYQKQTFYLKPGVPSETILLWDKNVVFFPRKIDGHFVFLHRIRPGIQIVKIRDLDELTEEYWNNYLRNIDRYIVMDPVYPYERQYIGAGCPPIETSAGWLLIYHTGELSSSGYYYSASAALLDLNDPSKVLSRLPYSLFEPESEYELKGTINNVVFPTGTTFYDGTLFIYYGAADQRIAVVSVTLADLLNELFKYKI
jgi:predicted GH43/DUF377 family glycosyl hydrolase